MNDPQFNQQIATDLAARIASYQQSIVAANSAQVFGKPNSPLKLLVDGDSWFDYPLGGAVPFVNHTDIIAQLPALCDRPPYILNLAHYGDATTTELGLPRVQKMIDAINTAKNTPNGQFDAILFSGGGDDVVGDPFCIWLNDAADVGNNAANGLNAARLGGVLDLVEASYLDLIQLRNDNLPGAPIFVHSYDFAIPSGVPACPTAGPWMKPSLDYCGWTNLSDATQIVRNALTQFGDLMRRLAQDPANNLILVPTQGVLESNEWANELHPTPSGFNQLALEFLYSIRAKFPGRI